MIPRLFCKKDGEPISIAAHAHPELHGFLCTKHHKEIAKEFKKMHDLREKEIEKEMEDERVP